MADVAPIGDNQPPADADPLRDRLRDEHEALGQRSDELLAAALRAPEDLTDDNAGQVADFVKQIGAHRKKLDTVRVAEKEPYLQGGRTVDGFFKTMTGALDKAATGLRIKTHDLRASEGGDTNAGRASTKSGASATRPNGCAWRLRRRRPRPRLKPTSKMRSRSRPRPARPNRTPSKPARTQRQGQPSSTRPAATMGRHRACARSGTSPILTATSSTSKRCAITCRPTPSRRRCGRTSRPAGARLRARASSRTQGV